MSMTLVVKPTIVDRVLPKSIVTDLALVVMGAALTALFAQIQVPVPGSPVPMTLQTLGVLLTGAALGSARGSISMALYALAGLALPVYANASHGATVLFGATGGYIIGFILAAGAVGRLAELNWSNHVAKMAVSSVAGSLTIYAVGVSWLAVVAAQGNFAQALAWGFTPFVVGDIIKAVAAAALVPGAWALIAKLKGSK